MRILVVAQGRHGTTEAIAEAVAEGLGRHGIEVDLRHPDAVSSLHGYDAIVVGSSIYLGRWVKPMRRFVRRFETELIGLPTWLYSCGTRDGSADTDGASAEVAEMMRQVRARGHVHFEGPPEPDLRGLLRRLGSGSGSTTARDFPDWVQINRWARSVAGELVRSRAVSPQTPPMVVPLVVPRLAFSW